MCYCKYMNSRPGHGKPYQPTKREHEANIVTHGLFILPSLFATYFIVSCSTSGSQQIIAWIYGVTLCLMFSSSTLHHIVSYKGLQGKLQFIFHLADRAVIYFFIAASWTPWMVLKKHSFAEEIVWVTWLAAVFGVIYQYSFHERFKWLEIVIYLSVGICPSVFIFEMADHEGVTEMALGGSIYIVGIIFFKSDGIIPFAHAIWHCFVAAAAACHYFAVIHYLYPACEFAMDSTCMAEHIA